MKILATLLKTTFVLVFIGAITLCNPKSIRAAADYCSSTGITVGKQSNFDIVYDPGPWMIGTTTELPFTINTNILKPGTYKIRAYKTKQWYSILGTGETPTFGASTGVINVSLTGAQSFQAAALGDKNRQLYLESSDFTCYVGEYSLQINAPTCGPDAKKTVWQMRDIAGKQTQCFLSANSCTENSSDIFFKVTGLIYDGGPYSGDLAIQPEAGTPIAHVQATNGTAEGSFSATAATNNLQLVYSTTAIGGSINMGWCGDIGVNQTVDSCVEDACSLTEIDAGQNADVKFDLCSQVSKEQLTSSDETQYNQCMSCFANGDALWTAVGCISTKPQGIVEAVVKIGVGIGGGIALLTTLVGGFLITTSQGDPKRIQQGKEMITASVIGILFVLFSVVILQFIGVTIFRIPGFGT